MHPTAVLNGVAEDKHLSPFGARGLLVKTLGGALVFTDV